MAAEPINIFSHKRDFVGIAALVRQLVPDARISGTDETWERITIQGSKSWFRKASILVFKNVPDYYTGPDWPNQVTGMQGYFSRFPDVPRKPDISTARFCNDDLAIGDTPIGNAPEEEFRKALSTANERHLAINWLVDGGEIYSETDAST